MSDRRERAAEVATAAKRRVDAKLGHLWWAVLVRGLLAIALAVCVFAWPEKTLGLFVKLLGAYFLFDGVIGAISAFRSGDKASPLLQTVVSLAIGLVLILWTGISAKLFLIFVGVWLALQGINLLVAAFRMDPFEGERGLTMVIGGILALIGIVFVFWTDMGVLAISRLIGVGAAVIGGLLIYLAIRVKRLRTRIGRAGSPA